MKAEYCKKICQQYDGFVHLGMGALLRGGVKQNPEDETWNALHEYIRKGEIIPNVQSLIKSEFAMLYLNVV